MRKVIKLYRLFNRLSIDVAVGAVISALLFAKIYAVSPSFTSLISLGLTVWIIYTADRLLDVRDAKGEVHSERHRFHQRNAKELIRWLTIMAMIDLILVFYMPTQLLKLGILLFVIVMIYICLRRHLHLLKEFFVALIYTAGVVLPVFPIQHIRLEAFLPLLPFFFIALLNLIIFSNYERENDLNDHQESIATILNERSIQLLLSLLFIITFSLSGVLLFVQAYLISLIYIVMTVILFLISRHAQFFKKDDYYRLAGDAIFLLPLIYILE